MSSDDPRRPNDPDTKQERTSDLIARIQAGHTEAREILFARYLPVLKRWARHRLPQSARDLRDTDDLVQDTLLRTLERLQSFEDRGEGAFLAYLRQGLLNAVRDDLRRATARPHRVDLDDSLVDTATSTLDRLIGRDQMERIERGLAKLTSEQREAIFLRIEFGYSHQQVADAIGKPSANTARMTVARALVELARAMHEE